VQTERNAKQNASFVFISEVQPIFGTAKVCKPSEMPNLFEHFRGAAYLRHSQSVQTERNAKLI